MNGKYTSSSEFIETQLLQQRVMTLEMTIQKLRDSFGDAAIGQAILASETEAVLSKGSP